MNIQENLILVKNQDQTEKIKYCKRSNGKWRVTYDSGKAYDYNDQNVVWYRNAKSIEPDTKIVYVDNQPISGIFQILDFGEYTRLIFNNGFQKIYTSSVLRIEETSLNADAATCFDYLKELAEHVSVDDDGKGSFLGKQYSGISAISPHSVLAAYLEGRSLEGDKNEPQVIFPFGFNLSQKSATETAMIEPLCVIEGPPGTGKTQTILNIIANAIMNGKTVAIVSNNNSATANVLEKLEKYEVGFIAAYLGSKKNRERFFEEQKTEYPEMSDWKLTPDDFQSIKRSLGASQLKLNEMLAHKNKQARLKQELSTLKTEMEYFNQYYSDSRLEHLHKNALSRLNSGKILNFLLQYERLIEQGPIPFMRKVYNVFAFGIYHFKFYRYSPETIISDLQKMYYDAKKNELQRNIDDLEKKLDHFNFDVAMNDYSDDSMKLFKAKLADTYGNKDKRTSFSKDVLWKNFDQFINDYQVILSTTHSLRNCAAKNYLFDYVLIDEASQVDVVTGALSLSCARRAVIVGDLKQLPNVVSGEAAEIANRIFSKYNLNPAYNYVDKSLLSSVQTLYKDIPKTLLKEHYRCHPKIIEFCNQKFYNNELIVLKDSEDHDKPMILYKTSKGNHARGNFNQRQIDIIFDEIIPQQNSDNQNRSLGVISPYRQQANELQKVGSQNIEADTVHKYQGRERDVIILSTVSNEIKKNDFVDNPNLINVAVSRAVDQLIVVVAEGSENWKGTNIGDLVKFIQYNNFEVIESKVYSVFDLLYSSYSDKLLEVMKTNKKVSQYDSENLMNIVIKKVLSREEFQNLRYVLHQPLRMLIKDTEHLTDAERKYAMNVLTHTDFVIFNKLDKMPILVVEVDGHAYHADKPVQLKRDKMKDEILAKHGIPIIRMKTTGSNEESKLYDKLVELV
ncbi:AAA domain-containing protein [Alkalihalobacillus hemicellulosilyticus]|uniref:DNA helicase n=1 Tax=Halalkalibacter hemicellulosilyticusJCM 9152 TaxID=1236971 RepID=W4QMA7_9BACI|nr:AAA domain-containing protein [Halalkalibacter hemicellulosilyticus]GAE32783.1 DNA helicase [Halalkalibacter hemicellulosilyticusJCM 9152]